MRIPQCLLYSEVCGSRSASRLGGKSQELDKSTLMGVELVSNTGFEVCSGRGVRSVCR